MSGTNLGEEKPKRGAPPIAVSWLEGLLDQRSLMAPYPSLEMDGIRAKSLLALGKLTACYGVEQITVFCQVLSEDVDWRREDAHASLSWPGRGQLVVGTQHWRPEQVWQTSAGAVRFLLEPGPSAESPEDRLVLAGVSSRDDELILGFARSRKGSSLQQLVANQDAVTTVLASKEAAPFLADLGRLASTTTRPDRTALEAQLVRFTKRRPRQLILRPALEQTLWASFQNGKAKYVGSAGSSEEAAKRWELGLALETMIRPIIDVLVVDEQRLLERWQSNPQVRDEHFLVSMARLPRGLQQEVLNIEDQQERWQECYGSDFQVNACVVDTSLLPIELSERVAAAVLGDETGVLIHGDAVRGMRYLQTRSDISLRCAYADPPYNTGGDDFPYVDGMPHSHWLCFMEQILKALAEVCETGVVMLSIGDREAPRLQLLLQECFGEENGFGPVIVQVNKGGRDYLPIALTHEYLLGSGLGGAPKVIELPRVGQGFRYSDAKGGWDERELRNRNPRFHKNNRPNLYYPFYVNLDSDDENGHCDVSLEAQDGWLAVWPLNAKGESSVWRWGRSKSGEAVLEGQVSTAGIVARKTRNGKYNIYEKLRKTTTKAKSIWEDSSVRTEQGSIELRGLFGAALFPHPKPRALVERCLQLGSEPGQWVLDFFGGSGTTADAALSLARQGLGVRPVVLIERGEHFERVLKRRVVKAAYSGNWASGRPVDAAPVSVCYRVVTLRDW